MADPGLKFSGVLSTAPREMLALEAKADDAHSPLPLATLPFGGRQAGCKEMVTFTICWELFMP